MCYRQNNSFGGLEYGEEEEHDKFVQLQKQKEMLQKQVLTLVGIDIFQEICD